MATTRITTGERIAVLEQRVGDLIDSVAEVKGDLKDIKASLIIANNFATEIKFLQEKVKELEGKSNLWKWLSPTLAAVCGSVMTFFILRYFDGLAK